MTAFLRNSLGFFIQLFPCMFMIFLPFSPEAYRFQRKWVFAGVALGAAVLAMLFPVFLYSVQAWNVALTANLFMSGVILLTLVSFVWLVREVLIKKVLIFFIASFYAAAQYWLVNTLCGFLGPFLPLSLERESWAVYSPLGLAMYLLTALLLLPFMLIFVIRPLKEYIQEVETREMRREFLVLIVSTVIFIVLMMFLDLSYYGLEYRLYLQELPLFLLALLDQILIFWLVFRESVRRKRDNEQQRTLEIQQLQYEQIVGDMESTRRMRHDLRHHCNALSALLEQGQWEEMKDYLANLSNAATQRINEVYCKNMTVNGLLQYYVGQAKDGDIRCEVRAECGELGIAPEDLTVVLGNAFENAIHACKKLSQNRWINLHIGTVQGSLAIEISNSCKGIRFNRRFQTEDGFAPAEAFLSDREGGGYGLRSIAHTAQKYGGTAKFRFNPEKETFTTRIRLNTHAEL